MDEVTAVLHPISGCERERSRAVPDTTHQVVLWPQEYKTGSVIYPYQDAKKQ
jgi:hypothetical protein